jgi:hypothetical protein
MPCLNVGRLSVNDLIPCRTGAFRDRNKPCLVVRLVDDFGRQDNFIWHLLALEVAHRRLGSEARHLEGIEIDGRQNRAALDLFHRFKNAALTA